MVRNISSSDTPISVSDVATDGKTQIYVATCLSKDRSTLSVLIPERIRKEGSSRLIPRDELNNAQDVVILEKNGNPYEIEIRTEKGREQKLRFKHF